MNENIHKKYEFVDLGMKDYQEAWDYQEALFRKTIQVKINNRSLPAEEQLPTTNYLIFCEHPHVYTLGKSGDEGNLLLNQEGLMKHNASYYRINRGGDITYHGPGQLVAYPIFDLENFFTDIHKYMRTMEEAVIRTLRDFKLETERIEGLTGVWLNHASGPAKICAMGVKSSRWVTMHGLALNVNPSLEYFSHIIPCGIHDKEVTSMEKELGSSPEMEQVKQSLKSHFEKLFELTPLEVKS
jgi:lipoyl(octanoyl) transferase